MILLYIILVFAGFFVLLFVFEFVKMGFQLAKGEVTFSELEKRVEASKAEKAKQARMKQKKRKHKKGDAFWSLSYPSPISGWFFWN